MRLVILHTILMMLWLGTALVADVPPTPLGKHAVAGRNEKGESAVFYFDTEADKNQFLATQQKFRQSGNFFIDPLLAPPVARQRAEKVAELVEAATSKTFSNDDEAKDFFTTFTRNIIANLPPGKSDPNKVNEFVDNLVAINKKYEGPLVHLMNDRKFELENVLSKARSAKEIATAQEARDAAQKDINDLTKKEKTEKDKDNQNKDLLKQKELEPLIKTLNDVAGGGGGGPGPSPNSSGNPPNNNNKPPEFTKNDNNSPKHDNLADQLSKALNQNNNNSNLGSLFGNNNNSNSSNSGNEKKKEDGFKFDISPKNSQNKVEPVKAGAPKTDSNSPLDPSQGIKSAEGIGNVLNGPTSVPQLMAASASNPFNPSSDGGGSSGGGGSTGSIKGGMPSSGDGGSAAEIFSSVGKVDYGELPPPIRKDSAVFGGELGGGEGGSEGSVNVGSSSSPRKQVTLIDELLLMSENPRVKGRGIMALVGFQVKDFCQQAGANKMAVCQFRKFKNRQGKISLNP